MLRCGEKRISTRITKDRNIKRERNRKTQRRREREIAKVHKWRMKRVNMIFWGLLNRRWRRRRWRRRRRRRRRCWIHHIYIYTVWSLSSKSEINDYHYLPVSDFTFKFWVAFEMDLCPAQIKQSKTKPKLWKTNKRVCWLMSSSFFLHSLEQIHSCFSLWLRTQALIHLLLHFFSLGFAFNQLPSAYWSKQ